MTYVVTVLERVLFTTYTSILSFADDTAKFYESETWIALKQKVERDMKILISPRDVHSH